MNIGQGRLVPRFVPVFAIAASALLGGCMGPDLSPGAGSLTAAETAPPSPERVAAVAEMRSRGDRADKLPYPDAFQADQTRRLAARQEPRTTPDAAAIQAELAAIAVLQRGASTPEEIAELRVRESALRQSMHEQAGRVQR